MLLDRLPERAALSQLLDAARAGRSGVLVLRGEPGIGKTALLEYAIESAAGLRVARVAGVESEMELAFAALQQLCAPMLGQLAGLPDPQRDALGVAFGLKTGAAPDRFLVGLAVLSLLSEAAEQQPLLCVVDDAQWLDRASAQVLAFVARRLLAEPVALVFATREPGEEFRGLPELRSGVCVRAMRGSCSARWSAGRWMSGCGTVSSRRRGAIRWRCSSCREAKRRRNWPAGSACRVCRICPGCRGRRGGLRIASGGGWRFCRPRPSC